MDGDAALLRQRIQRDLNALRDENRAMRTRALKRLVKLLPGGATPEDPEALAVVMHECLVETRLLTRLLGDEAEKCRELSAQVLLAFADDLSAELPPALARGARAALLGQVAEVARARIGSTPFAEPAEEVRLQLVKLVQALVCATSGEGAKDGDAMETTEDDAGDEGRRALEASAEDLCLACARALADNFPEVKRLCAELVVLLSQPAVLPSAVRKHQEPLVRALLLNLGHQHSKTRTVTLKALGAAVACGCDAAERLWTQTLEPVLAQKTLFDRSSNVRRQLYRTAASWLLLQLEPATAASLRFGKAEPALLAVVLAGCVDTHDQVAEDAERLMEKIGEAYEEGRRSGGGGGGGGGGDDAMDTTAAEAQGAGAYVRAHLAAILPQLLSEASHWTASTRCSALLRLEAVARYAGGAVEGYLDEILASLAGAFADDTPDVAAAARRVSARVGTIVDPRLSLGAVLPRASGRVDGGATASAMSGYMELLAALLEGMNDAAHALDAAALAGMAGGVAAALASAEVCAEVVDDAKGKLALGLGHALVALCCRSNAGGLPAAVRGVSEAMYACVLASATLAVNGAETGSGVVDNSALLDGEGAVEGGASDLDVLKALKEDEDAVVSPRAHGVAALTMLSRPRFGGDVQAMLTEVLAPALARLSSQVSLPPPPEAATPPPGAAGAAGTVWTKEDAPMKVWCALLRFCQGATALETVLHQVYAVVTAHVGESAPDDVEVKLPMLVLLDYVLGQLAGAGSEALKALVVPFVLHVIAPNIVWKAGRTAAMVRKMALACLEGLLRSGSATPEALVACAPRLMPLLKTALDDYDSTGRRLASAGLCRILQSLKGAIGEEPVHQMYHDLSKKLDDSDDLVRLQACGTLRAFYEAAAPGALRGTMVEWSAQTLLIHLDDPDARMQQEVYGTLETLLRCAGAEGAKAIISKAEQARLQHRSPDLCDQLLAAARAV